jgi:hypothetical protein
MRLAAVPGPLSSLIDRGRAGSHQGIGLLPIPGFISTGRFGQLAKGRSMTEPEKPADLPPQGPLPLRINCGNPSDFILPIRMEPAADGWRLCEYWEWRNGRWQRGILGHIIVRKEDFNER